MKFLGHAVVGHVPVGVLGHLENHVCIVFDSRTHVEEQTAYSFVVQDVTAIAVLVEDCLAFFVRKFTADTVKNCHEGHEV